MSHSSARTSITKNEYYQLIGLRAVADQYNEMLSSVCKAARNITQELDHNGELDDMGHTSDCMYGSRSVDEMLELIGLVVEEK